jgi:hypothetical protein
VDLIGKGIDFRHRHFQSRKFPSGSNVAKDTEISERLSTGSRPTNEVRSVKLT